MTICASKSTTCTTQRTPFQYADSLHQYFCHQLNAHTTPLHSSADLRHHHAKHVAAHRVSKTNHTQHAHHSHSRPHSHRKQHRTKRRHHPEDATTTTRTSTSTSLSTSNPTTTHSHSSEALTSHTLSHSNPQEPISSISINLRLSGSTRALLAQDIFIPVNPGDSLTHLFRTALVRHPTYVGRYILRRDKSVIVLCTDHSLSTYVKPSLLFTPFAGLKPVRLIFCVYPNHEVIRVLDARQSYSLTLNVRSEQGGHVLEHDHVVDVEGSTTVTEVWEKLKSQFPALKELTMVALQTIRESDGIPLRFGFGDIVSDIVKSHGKRYVFVVQIQVPTIHPHEHHHHHVHNQKEKREIKFKPMFRFRQDPCEHGKKKVIWGLIQKK